MSEPRITYTPHPDATPEAEASALANAYRFIFDSARKRGLLDKSGPEDPERRSDEIRASSRLP